MVPRSRDRLRRRYYGLLVAMLGKTKRHQQAIYLDHEKAALLDRLAIDTRVPKQAYFREAVDDLLAKYGRLKELKRKK